MSNKLDLAAVEQYSERYAAKVCDEFFQRNEIINGQQVLNLSAVGQVNLLVVSSLFGKWQAETARLQSPYFDFEHEAVQQALQGFMNTVSQYIGVRRHYFEPLLREATTNSLVLLFDPKTYFSGIFSELPLGQLNTETAKQLNKYTRVNKFITNELEQKIATQGQASLSQLNTWLDEWCSEERLDDPEKYVALFSAKVPLERTQLFRPDKPTVPKSFFDLEPEELPEPTPIVETPRPVVAPITAIPARETVAEPSVAATVQSKLATEEASLNDTLKHNESGSLADALASTPLESIPSAISLNQKIMFINQLFHGDAVAYTQAVMELENCRHFDEANGIIEQQYATKYLWKMSPEEAEEFVEIVRRRFT